MNKQIFGAVAVSVLALAACGGGGGGGGGSAPAPTFTVGGTVTGLDGSDLVLQNNNDPLGIAGDGGFTFAATLASGDAYAVTVVLDPTEPWQTCAVVNGNGVVGTADVTDVEVNCTTNAYTIRGSVSGLTATGLALQNNGGAAGGGEDLTVPANASGFGFPSPVLSGERYEVTVGTQPAGETCAVNNGAGTVAGEDIAAVTVHCSALTYTITVSVTGLVGSGLELRNGSNSLSIAADGDSTFSEALPTGSQYTVLVAAQPTNPAQNCFVTNGSGNVGTSNVIGVIVQCVAINTSGSLDLGFDADGIVLTDVSGVEDFGRAAVVVQPDDKIVVAGYARTNGALYEFALARYHTDGRLDETGFGGNGTGFVMTNIGSGESRAMALALQSDGRIVVAGFARVGVGDDFALARYNTDGSLDTSFGSNGTGIVTTDFGSLDYGQAVAIDPLDDSIVVAGRALAGVHYDFALARYTAAGVLDPNFDGDGKVTTDFNNDHDFGYAVAIQPDRMIVVAGYAENGADKNFALARYHTDGRLDETGFGVLGKVTTNIGAPGRADFAQAIALQATGEILVAGYTFNGANNDFALVRYTAVGALDTSFDGDGKVTTDIGGAGDEAYGMALDTPGNVVLVGRSFNGTNYDFAIVRYTPSGALDTSFAGGFLTAPVTGDDNEAYDVAIQPDGKIVVVGHAVNGSNPDFALIRVIP